MIQVVASLQELDVPAEHVEINAALRRVDDDRARLHITDELSCTRTLMWTYGQRAHRRDVPALPALRLDDKDPIPTRRRALLQRIACAHQRVEACVAPQAELRYGHVVRDCRRQVHHRDLKRRVVRPRVVQEQQRVERLEPADHQQRVEVVLLELRRDRAHVDVRQLAVRAQLGSAARHPGIDAQPRELVYVVVEQTQEPVVDREWFMSLSETIADCGARCGIHATSGCPDAIEWLDRTSSKVICSY